MPKHKIVESYLKTFFSALVGLKILNKEDVKLNIPNYIVHMNKDADKLLEINLIDFINNNHKNLSFQINKDIYNNLDKKLYINISNNVLYINIDKTYNKQYFNICVEVISNKKIIEKNTFQIEVKLYNNPPNVPDYPVYIGSYKQFKNISNLKNKILENIKKELKKKDQVLDIENNIVKFINIEIDSQSNNIDNVYILKENNYTFYSASTGKFFIKYSLSDIYGSQIIKNGLATLNIIPNKIILEPLILKNKINIEEIILKKIGENNSMLLNIQIINGPTNDIDNDFNFLPTQDTTYNFVCDIMNMDGIITYNDLEIVCDIIDNSFIHLPIMVYDRFDDDIEITNIEILINNNRLKKDKYGEFIIFIRKNDVTPKSIKITYFNHDYYTYNGLIKLDNTDINNYKLQYTKHGNINEWNTMYEIVELYPTIEITNMKVKNITCKGDNDGRVDLSFKNSKILNKYKFDNTTINGTISTDKIQINNLSVNSYNIIIYYDESTKSIYNENIKFNIKEPGDINIDKILKQNINDKYKSGSIIVIASGGTIPYEYTWFKNGNKLNNEKNNKIINLSVGNYKFIITDKNNCKIESKLIIIEDQIKFFNEYIIIIDKKLKKEIENIQIKFTNNKPLKLDDNEYRFEFGIIYQVEITKNGYRSFNGFIEYDETSPDGNNLKYTRDNQTVRIDDILVYIPINIIIDNNFSLQQICKGDNNGKIKLIVSGGSNNYKYEWYKNGKIILNETTDYIDNLSAGKYKIKIIDIINNHFEEKVINITEYSQIIYEKIPNIISSTSGNNGSIEIKSSDITGGSGNYSYTWKDQNGQIVSNSITATQLQPGNYTLTISDINTDCFVKIGPYNVSNNLFQVINIQQILCEKKETFSIEITGGKKPYQLEIYKEKQLTMLKSFDSSGKHNITINYNSNDSKTTYQLVFTDSLSNKTEKNIDIVKSLTYIVNKINNINCYGETGSFDITVLGGNGEYKWKIIDTNTGNLYDTITSLPTGKYTITILDDKDCSYTDNKIREITSLEQIKIKVDEIIHPDCNQNNGSIKISVTGGSGDYNYKWIKDSEILPDKTQDISNLLAGNYIVTVTDKNYICTEITSEIISLIFKDLVIYFPGDDEDIISQNSLLLNEIKNDDNIYSFEIEINSEYPTFENIIQQYLLYENCQFHKITKNSDNKYTIEIEANDTVSSCSVTIPENSICNNNSKIIQFQISTAVKQVAKVELTIDENIEDILPQGETEIDVDNPTPNQEELIREIIKSLAESLGVSIDEIKLTSITSGSIIIKFELSTKEDKDPKTLVEKFTEDLKDPTSELNQSGSLLSKADPEKIETEIVEIFTNISNIQFPSYVNIYDESEYSLNFNISTNSQELDVKLYLNNNEINSQFINSNSSPTLIDTYLYEVNFNKMNNNLISNYIQNNNSQYTKYILKVIINREEYILKQIDIYYSIKVDVFDQNNNFVINTADISIIDNNTKIDPYNIFSYYLKPKYDYSIVINNKNYYQYMGNIKYTDSSQIKYKDLFGNINLDQVKIIPKIQVNNKIITDDIFPVTQNILETCFGKQNGKIKFKVTNGFLPSPNNNRYKFYLNEFDNGINVTENVTISNLNKGNYISKIEDLRGNFQRISFTIPEIPDIIVNNITIVPYIVKNTNISKGSIELSISGGSSNQYTCQILRNSILVDEISTNLNCKFVDLLPGTYNINIIDSNNCNSVKNNIIIENYEINDILTNVTCNNNNNGSIELSINGGSGNYTYIWYKNNEVILNQVNNYINNLSANNYKVQITDKIKNYQIDHTFTITEPELINIEYNTPETICYGSNNGMITINNITGGTLPYKIYRWKKKIGNSYIIIKNENNLVINGLSVGNYKFEVIDNNNCISETQNIEIQQYDQLIYDVNNIIKKNLTGSNSNNGEIKINSSDVIGRENGHLYNYTWYKNNQIIANANTSYITNLSSGIYSVIIEDLHGCQLNINNIQITQPNKLVVDLEKLIIIDSINYNLPGFVNSLIINGGIPPYNFYINNIKIEQKDINIIIPNQHFNLNIHQFGSYNLEVRDVNNNIFIVPINITRPDELKYTVNINNTQMVNCYGRNNGSFEIIPDGGILPYTWEIVDVDTAIIYNDYNNLPAGNYTIKIIDKNNYFYKDNISYSITQPDELIATVESLIHSVNDTDGNITYNITGGSGNYKYSEDGIAYNNLSSNILQFNKPVGTYDVYIKDSNDCIIYKQFQIESRLQINLTLKTLNTNEFPKIIKINFSHVVDILLSPQDISQFITVTNGQLTRFDDNNFIQVIDSLNYNIKVEPYMNSYKKIINVLIKENQISDNTLTNEINFEYSEIKIFEEVQHVKCYQTSTGSISLNIVGGSIPYDIIWNNDSKMKNIYNLFVGNYDVTITDHYGNSTSKSIVITQPNELVIENIEVDNNSINIEISGGKKPYTFQWNNGSITKNIKDLEPGNYYFIITDRNRCKLLSPYIYVSDINNFVIPDDSINIINNNCYGESKGSFYHEIQGGTMPYTYILSRDGINIKNIEISDTEITHSNLVAGEYTYSITDSSNSNITGSLTITQPSQIIIDYITNYVSQLNTTDGKIITTVSGGSGNYSYKWTHNINYTNKNIYNLIKGYNYQIEVTDNDSGCIVYSDVIFMKYYITGYLDEHLGHFKELNTVSNTTYWETKQDIRIDKENFELTIKNNEQLNIKHDFYINESNATFSNEIVNNGIIVIENEKTLNIERNGSNRGILKNKNNSQLINEGIINLEGELNIESTNSKLINNGNIYLQDNSYLTIDTDSNLFWSISDENKELILGYDSNLIISS